VSRNKELTIIGGARHSCFYFMHFRRSPMAKPWWKRALDSGHYARRGHSAEYIWAEGFVPAATTNFTESNRSPADIDRVVIHITGGVNISSAVSTFATSENANRTSSHYVVGQDGEVYQMVKEKDRAHHAGSSANRRSIGIEHGASNRSGESPTDIQYWSSAVLVRYLCNKYAIPLDRTHILGHQEIATTNHNCPGPNWDWAGYMQKIRLCHHFTSLPLPVML